MSVVRSKPRYALLGAGAVARTILAEIPCLTQELGPVAATTGKLAARIANAMQAGHAVRELSEFQDCDAILICAPDTGLDRAVAHLLAGGIEWPGKVLLFCFSGVASLDFQNLQDQGAAVGAMNEIDGLDKFFVVEGAPLAVREAKRLLKDLKGKYATVRYLELNRECIRLFEAARTISGSLFTPLLNSCVEWIRESGVENKEAAKLAEGMLLWTLRSYLHSGRRGWTGLAAAQDREAIELQYEAVKNINPLQAEYFRSMADHAIALYESYPGLAARNQAKPSEEE